MMVYVFGPTGSVASWDFTGLAVERPHEPRHRACLAHRNENPRYRSRIFRESRGWYVAGAPRHLAAS